MISTRNLGWTALTLTLLTLAGCGPQMEPDPEVKPASPAPDAPAKIGVQKDKEEVKPLPVDPKGAAAPAKLTDEEIAEIKKLPPEDQAIALAQVICPANEDGSHLGEMGVPIKQTIGDKTFFICCKGCLDQVKNHPDQVLAKLKK